MQWDLSYLGKKKIYSASCFVSPYATHHLYRVESSSLLICMDPTVIMVDDMEGQHRRSCICALLLCLCLVNLCLCVQRIVISVSLTLSPLKTDTMCKTTRMKYHVMIWYDWGANYVLLLFIFGLRFVWLLRWTFFIMKYAQGTFPVLFPL